MSEIHAERRQPSRPEAPLDLEAAGDSLLKEARDMSSGRAAKSLTPGAHAPLMQTLIALRAGVELDEHMVNGRASIQLLRGSATIRSDDGAIGLVQGQWAPMPVERHNLVADEDVVALVTVAATAKAHESPDR